MKILVRNSANLHGKVQIPASKSHSLRAAIFACLADGESRIRRPLSSPDADACLRACEQFGAKITRTPSEWRIIGTGGNLRTPSRDIDVGNSGISLRFITALAAACGQPVRITGDESIQKNRTMKDTIKLLTDLGVKVTSNDGFAPLTVEGPLRGGIATIQGKDSQPVSAGIIASLLSEDSVEIRVLDPGERPWLDLTLSWFQRLNLTCKREGYERYFLPGRQALKGFQIEVPGDFSSAAFPLALGLLVPSSHLQLQGLDMQDPQGDKKIITELREMGGKIEQKGNLVVSHSSLTGRDIDVNDFIDAIPILSVIACTAKGTTRLHNASIARTKECDRLSAMQQELEKMGADIAEEPDGLTIKSSRLQGAEVDSHNDHRVALSLIVAGLMAEGETVINRAECTAKTYRSFPTVVKSLGGEIEVLDD